MPSLRRLLRRLLSFLRPAWEERDLERELASHLRLLEDDYRRRGMTADEAARQARRMLFDLDGIKEAHRAERSFAWLEDARRDVHYAARTLARNRVFTAVSVATLAMGIGATTSVFSVVHCVLLRPLPYADSDRLVRVIENVPAAETRDGRPQRVAGLSGPDIADLQRHARSLAAVAGYGPTIVTASGVGPAVRMTGSTVSPALFAVLGARVSLGREFGSEDARPGATAVIVLSHDAWRRHFGGDPHVVGRTVILEGVLPPEGPKTCTVVGVLEAGLRFPEGQADFWIPSAFSRNARARVVARLAHGADLEAAATEMEAVLGGARGLRSDAPSMAAPAPRFELVRARDEMVAAQRPALLILMGAVALVLLIACVNVASLLLGRAAAREREFSIRVALGAGPGRLLRQLLTESLLLAFAGGLAGTVVAALGVRLFRNLGTTLSRIDIAAVGGLPRLDEVALHGPVLAFSLAISVATGLLFGLAPALAIARAPGPDRLRESAPTAARSEGVGHRRSVLVMAEVALAAVLLVGGGLLINSFARLVTVDSGYRAEDLLTFQVTLPAGYPEDRQREFAEELVARLWAVPSVRGAAYARQLPFVRLQDSLPFRSRMEPVTAGSRVDVRAVSRDYLDVLGVRVVAGRTFGPSDGEGAPPVLVINQGLARREFGQENAVGRTVYLGRDARPWTVVGVMADVRQLGLDKDPEPQAFVDLRQWAAFGPRFPLGAYYVLRTAGAPTAALPAVRRCLSESDPSASLHNVATMEQLVATSVWAPRLYTVLMAVFAAVALALAAIGIYGVVSYAVTRRTREIGVRVALGAPATAVLRLVLGQTMAATTWGLGIGMVGAAALARSLGSMLFGVTPFDPATYVAVGLTLAAIACLAALVPGRRALAVDPLLAIRHE